MLRQHAESITDFTEYNNISDCNLLKSADFQYQVEKKLKFFVKRHVELLHGAGNVMRMFRKWIPLYALCGVFLFVSCILFYFVDHVLYCNIFRSIRRERDGYSSAIN
ncbi:unnamed protein product [Tenebrio molitor]|nr:unnamed protein product [Tenebrio molitor]